jgi:hypothetical protein
MWSNESPSKCRPGQGLTVTFALAGNVEATVDGVGQLLRNKRRQ